MAALVKPPALCIFDLDGTLVDSLRDIAEALNESLEILGLPTHPVDSYRHMVGEGVPKLCQRAVGTSHPHLVNRLAEIARPRYRVRPLLHTRPYDGVETLLERLRQAGVRLAVLSNKPHGLTRTVVQAFWPEAYFMAVQGYVEEGTRKPSPHYLNQMLAAAGVKPHACCMIGDTPTDIAAARNAGVRAVGITWGFRTRADLLEAKPDILADTPAELADMLLGNEQ